MTPPAPMTVEGFLKKYVHADIDWRKEARGDFESMLLAAKAEGMREAVEHIQKNGILRKGIKEMLVEIQEKADALSKEGGVTKMAGQRAENPFYHNYVFRPFDIFRNRISLVDRLWLWMWPTYVQVSEGYMFKYKNVGGRVYLLYAEELSKERP